MIVAARVTVLDRYGVVVEEDARPVTLQVDGAPERTHHLVIAFGERAVAIDLGVVRQVIWLGHQRRAFGGLFEVDDGRLRLVDATTVVLVPIPDTSDRAAGLMGVRAGVYEVQLALEDVVAALAAPPIVADFAEPVGLTRH